MYINFSALAYRLYKYERIIFYGTGNIAGMLCNGLERMGITIDSCIVTHKRTNESYFRNTIPVYQVDEHLEEMRGENTVVLVAVGPQFEREIESILCNYGVKKYLLFSNFWKDRAALFRDYQTKTVEQCIEDIAGWHIAAGQKDWENLDKVKEELTARIADRTTIKNRIVVAVSDLKPRVLKIAGALRNAGKEVKIYIYPNAILREVCIDGLHKLGIPYHECICMEELMYELIMEQAEVVHSFSCGGNTVAAYVLIKMKELFSSHIVYDEYDIFNEFYVNALPEELEPERFCLEKADGICNRGYELDYLSQQCGYRFEGKTIQFIDYCRDEDIEQPEQCPGEALSVCIAGYIMTEKANPNSLEACLLELARKCAEAECHLHIYPSFWSEELFKDYVELDKVSEYFHFHHPVPYELLKKEMAQYDFGVHPIKAGFLQKETDDFFYKKEKIIYTMANRQFDFLDAGIPIIAAIPVFQSKYLESKGVLIPWAIEEYDFEYLRKNKRKYREAVKKAQKELQIKNHIHKLIEFYDSL